MSLTSDSAQVWQRVNIENADAEYQEVAKEFHKTEKATILNVCSDIMYFPMTQILIILFINVHKFPS